MEAAALLGPMLGVAGVIALAYFASRWLASRQMPRSTGRRIQVLERVPLTRDTSLVLARVGGKTYLLSAGTGRAELIDEIDEARIAEELPRGEGFSGFLARRTRAQSANPSQDSSEREEPR